MKKNCIHMNDTLTLSENKTLSAASQPDRSSPPPHNNRPDSVVRPVSVKNEKKILYENKTLSAASQPDRSSPLQYGYTYHIFNRGINGTNLFLCERDYKHFLDLYAKYVHPIADTYAWVLLKNHFHILIRIKDLSACEAADNVKKGTGNNIDTDRSTDAVRSIDVDLSACEAADSVKKGTGNTIDTDRSTDAVRSVDVDLSACEAADSVKKGTDNTNIDTDRSIDAVRSVEVDLSVCEAADSVKKGTGNNIDTDRSIDAVRSVNVDLSGCEAADSVKKGTPSRQFSHLFNAYARYFNIKYSRTGGLFETPFRRIKIDTEKYFRRLVYYIHNNPVKHGFAEHILDWGWSSYLTIVSVQPTRLSRETVLAHIAGVSPPPKKNFPAISMLSDDC